MLSPSGALYLNFGSNLKNMVHSLGNTVSIASHFLAALRDPTQQHDRMHFRKNVERLGQIMAYEISKKLSFEPAAVKTPLGTAHSQLLKHPPVLITILRAGIPYFNGFLDYFHDSDSGFIGAYRKESGDIVVHLDYLAAPSLKDRVVILIDPMLATGKSIVSSIEALKTHGLPAHIHIASLIAAPEGINHLNHHIALPYTLWTFNIDESLNPQSYIVPGLGDAGDLSYGDKL